MKSNPVTIRFKATSVAANCKVGKIYKRVCVGDEVCKPVEGSFVTECEVKGCKKFR